MIIKDIRKKKRSSLLSKKVVLVLACTVGFLIVGLVFNNSHRSEPTPNQLSQLSYVQQHDLPVVTINTDPDNLWDEEIGIYTDENYKNRGSEWQRPATVAFYETDGSLGFSKEIGLRIHGGGSRSHPQKSFRIYASHTDREQYIQYPLFSGEQVQRHHSLILRAGGGDWEGTMMRDTLIHRLAALNTDLDVQADRPVVLYLNGEYWGLYFIRQRQDQYYFARKYGLDPDQLTILEVPQDVGNKRGDVEVEYGDGEKDKERYNELLKQARSCKDCADLQNFSPYMDVENFIDYIIFQIHFANYDWPFGNSKVWRYQRPFQASADFPEVDGRFHWVLFDLDVGFGFGNTTTEEMTKAARSTGYGRFLDERFPFRNLFYDPDFKQMYLRRYAHLLNNGLDGEAVVSEIIKLHDQIASEIPRQVERWKDTESEHGGKVFQSTEEWERNVELLKVYATEREKAMFLDTNTAVEADGVTQLQIEDTDGVDFISINNLQLKESQLPWEGSYFKEVYMGVSVEPEFGYYFDHWEGDIPNSKKYNQDINFLLTKKTSITPVVEKRWWYWGE